VDIKENWPNSSYCELRDNNQYDCRRFELDNEIRRLRGMVNDLLAYIYRMSQMAAHDEAYSATIREIAADAMQHGKKVLTPTK
jgi:hypothetical protein